MIKFDPAAVAKATGAPYKAVLTSWPLIEAELVSQGMPDLRTAIAAAATIRVECPPFVPVDEYGGVKQWMKYEGRRDLGNTQSGDGVRFHGRGFIQLTGRANYRTYGMALGIPLETEPDLALKPGIAAAVFARYFKSRRVNEAAQAADWKRVRTLVNGGLNGWQPFSECIARLLVAFPEAVPR